MLALVCVRFQTIMKGETMRKKVIAVILASTMAAAGCVPVWAEAEGGDVVVLYTNDIHCEVNEDEENQVLGYAKVAGLKKQLEEEGNEVVLVDIGDAIQGDVIEIGRAHV